MRTPSAFGLAAAIFAAVLVPAAAISQAKKPADIPAAARKSGMAEAPAVVQQLGLSCQVADARLVGKDKKSNSSYYEVACASGGLGYILQAPAGAAPTAFSCIEANTVPEGAKEASVPCLLPGNADPKAALGPMLAASGLECLPVQARGIGQSKSGTFIEVACQGGVGYVVTASVPADPAKPAQAQNCLLYDEADSNIKCVLGDKASRLAVIDRYAQQAANGCTLKDRRFVGAARDGTTYYEGACQDGKGYMYKVTAKGALAETLECIKAQGIMEGCQLTDTRQAETEQRQLYTKLAQAAGGSCDVERYALFPPKPGEETVEMVCKSGKGAIGLFKAGGKGQVVDCGRAPAVGYRCSLTKDPSYDGLTADLRKFDRKDCVVSNARVVGKSQKGTVMMEVACADGLKGYMIEYQVQPSLTALGATGCAFAGGCTLPGNT